MLNSVYISNIVCYYGINNGEYYSTWGGFAEYGIAGDLDAYLEDKKRRYRLNQYLSDVKRDVEMGNFTDAESKVNIIIKENTLPIKAKYIPNAKNKG